MTASVSAQSKAVHQGEPTYPAYAVERTELMAIAAEDNMITPEVGTRNDQIRFAICLQLVLLPLLLSKLPYAQFAVLRATPDTVAEAPLEAV